MTQANILKLILIVLTAIAPALAAVQDAMTSTPEDVFGNTATREVERQITLLQSQFPSTREDAPDAEVNSALQKLESLVDSVSDKEQLLRLAFWGHFAKEESPVEIVHSTSLYALSRLKELYPNESSDSLLEAAMLLRADGHVGEMFENLLRTKPGTLPDKSPPGVYVYIEGVKDATTPTLLSLQFNLTRKFWSEWKPHWSGKAKFGIWATFELDKQGKVSRLELSKQHGDISQQEETQAITEIRRIIQSNQPYGPVNPKKRTKLLVQFYG